MNSIGRFRLRCGQRPIRFNMQCTQNIIERKKNRKKQNDGKEEINCYFRRSFRFISFCISSFVTFYSSCLFLNCFYFFLLLLVLSHCTVCFVLTIEPTVSKRVCNSISGSQYNNTLTIIIKKNEREKKKK